MSRKRVRRFCRGRTTGSRICGRRSAVRTTWSTGASSAFWDWQKSDPAAVQRALSALWHERADDERLDTFMELLPAALLRGPSARLSLASLLLSGIDATAYPWFRTTPFDFAYHLILTFPICG
jgi:hypothetical protein